jgi:hypothetical protein
VNKKTYEVELQRMSYVTFTVEAETVEEAEALAFREVEGQGDSAYASWEVESIEEVKPKE